MISKADAREEIIKVRAEINAREKRKIIEKTKETELDFWKRGINSTKKRRPHQLRESEMKRRLQALQTL